MDVVMMLCDAAEEANGKLFILGGGWSINRGGGAPINMALAIKVAVPWHEANRRHPLLIQLMTQDGQPALVGGNPVRIEGEVEVGRPPGLEPGVPLDAPLAINIGGLPLPIGAYRWELTIQGEKAAEVSFQVVAPG